jgi:hypothetical protein
LTAATTPARSTRSTARAGSASMMLALIATCTLVTALHHDERKAIRAPHVLRMLLVFVAGDITAIKLHQTGPREPLPIRS